MPALPEDLYHSSLLFIGNMMKSLISHWVVIIKFKHFSGQFLILLSLQHSSILLYLLSLGRKLNHWEEPPVLMLLVPCLLVSLAVGPPSYWSSFQRLF